MPTFLPQKPTQCSGKDTNIPKAIKDAPSSCAALVQADVKAREDVSGSSSLKQIREADSSDKGGTGAAVTVS